jgi:hypothetical protein
LAPHVSSIRITGARGRTGAIADPAAAINLD